MTAGKIAPKNSIVIMTDWKDLTDSLTLEQKGQVLDAIFSAACGEEVDTSDTDAACIPTINYITRQIERNNEKYQEIIEKRAAAGRKGGLSKQKQAKQANANFAKHTVSVSVSDAESVSDIREKKQERKEQEQEQSTASRALSGKPDHMHPKTREVTKRAIEHLNSKTGADYKPTTRATLEKVSARLNEGFSPDDFTAVIDNKVADWLNDKKMRKFLRPQTLFGTNFEAYLQEGRPRARDPAYGEPF